MGYTTFLYLKWLSNGDGVFIRELLYIIAIHPKDSMYGQLDCYGPNYNHGKYLLRLSRKMVLLTLSNVHPVWI